MKNEKEKDMRNMNNKIGNENVEIKQDQFHADFP